MLRKSLFMNLRKFEKNKFQIFSEPHQLYCVSTVICIYTYAIMKTICPPWLSTHNGFVATHALGQMLPQSHCGDNREGYIVFMIAYIYVMLILLLQDLSTLCVVDYL